MSVVWSGGPSGVAGPIGPAGPAGPTGPIGATGPGPDTALFVRKEALPYVALESFGPNIDSALTTALATLGANGGRIVLPRGALELLAPPSFAQSRDIILEGAGGVTAGAAGATQLTYKGTGPRGIDARSSHGFKLRDLQLLYDQAAFVGVLVDFSQSVPQDAAFMGIENVLLGSVGLVNRNAACLVSLDKAIAGSFREVFFNGAKLGVRGRALEPSYSNGHAFYSCTFLNQVDGHVRAGGNAWLFAQPVFEGLLAADGVTQLAGAYSSYFPGSKGVTFESPWCGDAGAPPAGPWFDLIGHGQTIRGGYVGGGMVGARCDGGIVDGVLIEGVVFDQNTYGVVVNTGGGYAQDNIDVDRNAFVTHTAANRITWGSYGAAAPTAGAHSQGEVRWNRAAAAAGTIGWICTASGTPGTWRAF